MPSSGNTGDGAVMLLSTAPGHADRTLIEWRFDKPADLLGWAPNAMLSDVALRDGALHLQATNRDPQLLSPRFAIPASPWPYVEVDLRGHRSVYCIAAP